MNLRKTAVLAALVFSAAVLLPAEDAASIQGVKAICSNFLEYVVADEYDSAFAYLKTQPNSISDDNFAELELLSIQQAGTIRQIYGEAIDVQLVKEDLAADFILKLVYVVRRENHIIRWEFIYYKPAAYWKLDAISFDDEITKVF
jgi:hypothetical protein